MALPKRRRSLLQRRRLPRHPPSCRAIGASEHKKMTVLRRAHRRASSSVPKNDTAMLTTFNEVDMQAIKDLRALYKDKFKEVHGVGLGFMGFFVRACCEAMKFVPNINSQIDGDDMVSFNYIDIGVAVSTDRGLVVPNIRGDAHKMSIFGGREGDRRICGQSPRRQDHARRHERRHIYHHQWWRVWLDAFDADLESAAERHLGHAQHRGSSCSGGWADRHPPDHVPGAELRSPPRRRQGGSDLPLQSQRISRGSIAAFAGDLRD